MRSPDGPFRVGVTRDLRAGEGRLRLGTLDELDAAAGVEWHFLEHDGPEADPADIAGVDALLVFAQRVTERSLEGADRLRVLARIGVGYDNVDLAACSRRGILLTTTPDAVRRPMASGALALLLGLAHRIVIKDRLVRAGGWQRRFEHVGEGLQGKTLGLLGFGTIARELSLLARPLELRQIAYTPRLQATDATEAGVEAVSLEVLLRESDFLVVACPLTDETRGLLDADRLALMKPTASLINIARGAVVDEPALVDALREGRLAGAALDVFMQEPVDPANPLLTFDQVIVAPHAIGHTDALFRAALASASRSILEAAAGGVPASAVNADAVGAGS
jgi:phosphoglycerate dehydrogenase-like enzyme